MYGCVYASGGAAAAGTVLAGVDMTVGTADLGLGVDFDSFSLDT